MHSSVPQQTVPTPPGTGQGCFLSTGRLLPCSAPLHGLQCRDVQPQREESTEARQRELSCTQRTGSLQPQAMQTQSPTQQRLWCRCRRSDLLCCSRRLRKDQG